MYSYKKNIAVNLKCTLCRGVYIYFISNINKNKIFMYLMHIKMFVFYFSLNSD